MFGFFNKRKEKGTEVTLKLSGLHCTSCSLNIDGELEETPGVLKSDTSYAKSQTTIVYDPGLVNIKTLTGVIEKLGYRVI